MARRFDVSEIEQIAAFYRSPVGRKSLEVMPLTMNDAMSEVGALVQKRMPAALERLNRAHGEGPAAPPPPAKTGSGSRPRGP